VKWFVGAAASASLIALTSCGSRETTAEEDRAAAADAVVAAGVPAAETAPDYSDPLRQLAWNELGEKTIRAKLRDPEGATFRNTKFFSGGGTPTTCGEVNAINGFGGKIGYQRFFAVGDTMAVIESEMADGEMNIMWARLCK